MTKFKQFDPPSMEETNRRLAAMTDEERLKLLEEQETEEIKNRLVDRDGNPVTVVFPST